MDELKQTQIMGALFTLILGTFLHFTFDWAGENTLVGIFSATNESTWEHLKLLAVPMLLFGIAEYFVYGKSIPNFVPVRVLSIFMGMCTIVVAFYTYVGIIGQHFLWADIGTFVVGVFVAYWFSARFLNTDYFSSVTAVRLGWIGCILLVVCFGLFTLFPPRIGLFLDPVSGL